MNKKKSHAACKHSRAAGLLQHYEILTALMNGRFRIEPRTGILLIKPTTTGKKPLDVMKVKARKREGQRQDYEIWTEKTESWPLTIQ